MFTGIIEGTGRVKKIAPPAGRSARAMTVDMGGSARGLKKGQSVSVNGVCLTATAVRGGLCSFEMIDETMAKTGMGKLQKGGVVNIERSIRAGGRLEGHFVLGHVDGTGTVTRIRKMPGEVRVWVRLPAGLAAQTVRKGSVALDGVSLTIASKSRNTIMVCLIPHTVKITNFGSMKEGQLVNVETDILGKYALSGRRTSNR